MPKIADDYGVGRVTIGDWVTIKAAILIKADEDYTVIHEDYFTFHS